MAIHLHDAKPRRFAAGDLFDTTRKPPSAAEAVLIADRLYKRYAATLDEQFRGLVSSWHVLCARVVYIQAASRAVDLARGAPKGMEHLSGWRT